MKHFLSSGRFDVTTTLASTVGSPSAHRRGTMLKHLFFAMLFLVAGIGQVWATDVTFTAGTDTGDNSVTKDGVTVSMSTMSRTDNYRTYANTDMTVSISSGNITTVEVTCTASGTSNYGPGKFSGTGYTYSGTVGTWTGSASNVTLSASAQVRITKIVVTYAAGGSTNPTVCSTPTFTPNGATFYTASQSVTIACSTDGATIHYTLDGSNPTSSSSTYTEALSLTETTTVKAIAVKEGTTDSEIASATFTKGESVPGYAIDFESDLVAYVDWEFTNLTKTNETISGHSSSTYFAKTNGTETASVTTKTKIATPGVLTFYISKIGNNTNASSYWQARVSSDKSTWTVVGGNNAAAYGVTAGTWNECTADLSDYSNVYVQVYYTGTTAVRALDDIELTMAAAINKPTISGNENFVTSTTVTLACTTDGATIYYTTDGSDPKSSATTGTSFSLTETATVRAIAKKGDDWSAEATQKTFTKITPITVAAAIAAIPNADDTENDQYVSGIVCTAGTAVNGNGQMTYYISDDGAEATRLQIYLGKNLDNTAFDAVSDLALGDRVVVFGQLKNYKGTKEMNSGNYLVAKEAAAVAAPVFSPDGGGFMGETDVTITCATASSTIYYTTDGTAPSKSSTPYAAAIHLDATKTIKAIAYVGEDASIVISKTFTLTAPMTVAEALSALDSENPINNAAVIGIISTAPTANPSSGNLTYYISDDGTTTGELEVYKGFGLNGASFSNKTDLQVGDEVTVFGNLTIFSTTKEFAEGSRLLAFNRPTVDVTGVTLPATASVKVGKTITLSPTIEPSNATNKNVSWEVTAGGSYASVNDEGVVTGSAAGTATITVTTEDGGFTATCEVTVADAVTFDNSSYEWQLVTNEAQLVAGNYYVIASSSKNKTATSTITSGYTGEVTSTVADGVIAYDALGTNTAVFQLGGTSDAWTLQEVVEQDKLLGGATTANLTWGTGTTTWPITIDANTNAIIGANDGYRILHNVNSNRFKTYNSATSTSMLLPQLYVWAPITYKLRYDANGGSNAPATQVAVAGSATVTSSVPTAPEDKVFDKWNTQNDGLGEDKAADDVIDLSSADVTLYAIWRDPVDYTVSYNANGGTLMEGKSNIEPEDVTEGDLVTVATNVYEKEGFVFGGWKLGENIYSAGQKFTMPSNNVELEAQWSSLNVTDFVLVTDVNQLKDGDKVYIVGAVNNTAMSTKNSTKDYYDYVEIQKSADNSHVVLITAEPLELTLGQDGDNFTFHDGTGYLCASSSSSNNMSRQTTLDNNGKWAITISEGVASIVAQGDKTRNVIQYNSNSGQERFSCYGSASMADVAIYKKLEVIRTDLYDGKWGTICPKQEVIYPSGASFYKLTYCEDQAGIPYKLFFDEIAVGSSLEKGIPYLFIAEGEAIKGIKVGDEATEGLKKSYSGYDGFMGYIGATSESFYNFTAEEVNDVEYDGSRNNYYGLINNTFTLMATGSRLRSERAVVEINSTQPTRTVIPHPSYSPRRLVVGASSPKIPTAIENAEASEKPAKMLIDGKLYILRGEKMYDATGRLVK